MVSPINRLQLLQQNLQAVSNQKQQYENQLVELESALAELSTTGKAYKIVGKLMLASPAPKLTRELQEKKGAVGLRLRNLTRQEDNLKKGLEEAQRQVVAELGKKK